MLICGTCTEAHAELETLATLSPQKRAIYTQGERMLDKLTLMRDSAETVYRNIERQFAGNGPNAVYTAQRQTLRTLEKIDDNIAAGRALMRMALTGGNATPREFQATALMLINCMENRQLAVDFIETDIDKASPFLFNWLALRAMEAGDNVKAYRYFIKGIRKMAEPAEPVYYPLFHNLGMFLCHSTPYINPEAVRSTQADFDNNRRICVENYTKAVPFHPKRQYHHLFTGRIPHPPRPLRPGTSGSHKRHSRRPHQQHHPRQRIRTPQLPDPESHPEIPHPKIHKKIHFSKISQIRQPPLNSPITPIIPMVSIKFPWVWGVKVAKKP